MPLKLYTDKRKKLAERLKNPNVLLVLGVAGILLIFVSSLFPNSKDKVKQTEQTASIYSAEEYRVALEEELKGIVKDITGDGKARVVVTLDSGIRYSYADATETDISSASNSDSLPESQSKSRSYVTVRTSDGSEKALLITEYMPDIRGVAIVCRGGENEQTAERIKGAVTAALDITSKRVYITGGK